MQTVFNYVASINFQNPQYYHRQGKRQRILHGRHDVREGIGIKYAGPRSLITGCMFAGIIVLLNRGRIPRRRITHAVNTVFPPQSRTFFHTLFLVLLFNLKFVSGFNSCLLYYALII